MKNDLQIVRDVLVVAVPNAAACQQTLPLFDVDDTVLTSPIIDVTKQFLMNETEPVGRKIVESLLIQQHHIGTRQLGFHKRQRLFHSNVQLIF